MPSIAVTKTVRAFAVGTAVNVGPGGGREQLVAADQVGGVQGVRVDGQQPPVEVRQRRRHDRRGHVHAAGDQERRQLKRRRPALRVEGVVDVEVAGVGAVGPGPDAEIPFRVLPKGDRVTGVELHRRQAYRCMDWSRLVVPPHVSAAILAAGRPVCAYVYDRAALHANVAALRSALPAGTRASRTR